MWTNEICLWVSFTYLLLISTKIIQSNIKRLATSVNEHNLNYCHMSACFIKTSNKRVLIYCTWQNFTKTFKKCYRIRHTSTYHWRENILLSLCVTFDRCFDSCKRTQKLHMKINLCVILSLSLSLSLSPSLSLSHTHTHTQISLLPSGRE